VLTTARPETPVSVHKHLVLEAYRTYLTHDNSGAFLATIRDKAPQTIHHAQVIRADFQLLADTPPEHEDCFSAPSAKRARARARQGKTAERLASPPPAPIPTWARANGRAGESDPLFMAGAALALLDAALRGNPPAAGAFRSRLALQSAAASLEF
jgi:hypothetical protein